MQKFVEENSKYIKMNILNYQSNESFGLIGLPLQLTVIYKIKN